MIRAIPEYICVCVKCVYVIMRTCRLASQIREDKYL